MAGTDLLPATNGEDCPDTRKFLDGYAERAIGLIAQEYPTWNGQLLSSHDGLSAPRERHPLFWGCYDWHSAVHTHWALAVSHRSLDPVRRTAVEDALGTSLNAGDAAKEARAWAEMDSADFFERPYGITWFLELMAQLRANSSANPETRVWNVLVNRLSVMEAVIARRALQWVDGLQVPGRSGQHDQSAWSLMLALDWADRTGNGKAAEAIRRKAVYLFSADYAAPVRYEPDDCAFFSPILNEAMLMGKVLDSNEYLAWLERFLPELFDPQWPGLEPVPLAVDDVDMLQAHHFGLGFTRAIAWRAIGSSTRKADTIRGRALSFAENEASAALRASAGRPYSVEHWVGSYAVAWLTGAFAD